MDEAESTSFSVELGDLIVLATDGLFDNVSTEQILKELSQLEVCFHFVSTWFFSSLQRRKSRSLQGLLESTKKNGGSQDNISLESQQ